MWQYANVLMWQCANVAMKYSNQRTKIQDSERKKCKVFTLKSWLYMYFVFNFQLSIINY
jgi:hypothetical protein